MSKFTGPVSARTKQRNLVKEWLQEPSSSSKSNCPEEPVDTAASDSSYTKRTESYSTLESIPNFSNLLPLRRSKAWGYICNQNCKIPTTHFYSYEITFGRSSSCGFTYLGKEHGIQTFIGNISNVHFTLHNCVENVYLEDHSMHGTFVNGTRVIGDKKKQVLLQSGDRISVVMDRGPGFFFYHLAEKVETLDTRMPPVITNRFHVASRLGKGASGQVYLIKDKFTFKKYALKMLVATSKGSGMNSKKYIENEIKIISSVQHDYIVKLEQIISHKNCTFIVMEKMNNSLQDILRSTKDGFRMHGVQLVAYQMLMALDYLHSKHIIHRDLKPGNILTTSCDIFIVKFKLADFGLSKIVSLSQDAQTNCGTQSYMAPEIKGRDHQASYTSKVDIWSLGATLYACACKKFYSKEEGAVNFSDKVWTDEAPWQARKCIEMMLKANPETRPSARELLEYSWFNDKEFEEFQDFKRAPIESSKERVAVSLLLEAESSCESYKKPIYVPPLLSSIHSRKRDASSGSKNISSDAPSPKLSLIDAKDKSEEHPANAAEEEPVPAAVDSKN